LTGFITVIYLRSILLITHYLWKKREGEKK